MSLQEWTEHEKETLIKINESENTILHHALALKLMQKLMAAYKDNDEEAKRSILAL